MGWPLGVIFPSDHEWSAETPPIPDWSWVDSKKCFTGFQKVILSESFLNHYYYKHLFNWPSVIFVRKTAKFRAKIFRKWIKMSVKWASGLNLLIKSIQHKYNPSNDYSIIPLAFKNQEILESVTNSSLI